MGRPIAAMEAEELVELLEQVVSKGDDAFIIGEGHWRKLLERKD
jgi:hypothetical protein